MIGDVVKMEITATGWKRQVAPTPTRAKFGMQVGACYEFSAKGKRVFNRALWRAGYTRAGKVGADDLISDWKHADGSVFHADHTQGHKYTYVK